MGACLVVLVADNREELREPELRRRGRTLGGELSDKALGVEDNGSSTSVKHSSRSSGREGCGGILGEVRRHLVNVVDHEDSHEDDPVDDEALERCRLLRHVLEDDEQLL